MQHKTQALVMVRHIYLPPHCVIHIISIPPLQQVKSMSLCAKVISVVILVFYLLSFSSFLHNNLAMTPALYAHHTHIPMN